MRQTKIMFLQFEIDAEELRDGWANGKYTGDQLQQAQGQAFYILELEHKIRGLKEEDND